MEYFQRGKFNRFDAYMAGFCVWISPRQIILLARFLNKFDILDGLNPIERQAILDFKSQIDHEAEVKKKIYE